MQSDNLRNVKRRTQALYS